MSQHRPGENYEHDQPCTNKTHAGQTYAQCGHTPGPWYVGVDKIAVWGIVTKIGKEPIIARCIEPLRNRNVREANARLIAKAPEMLVSLQELLRLVDGVSDWTPGSDVKIGRARALLQEIENA